MRTTYKIIAITLLPLVMGACIKDGYDKQNCPGSVAIKYDWSAPEAEASQDSIYIDVLQNDGKVLATGTTSKEDGTLVDLDGGTYNVVGFEKSPNVTLKGSNVSVGCLPDGSAAEPGAFCGGAGTFFVDESKEENVMYIPMHAQSRLLKINVTFRGYDHHLSSLQGTVEGIALSRDINYGFVPVNGKSRNPAITDGHIRYDFVKGEDRVYSCQKRLLGIDGEDSQTLSLEFGSQTKAAGSRQDFDITHDMDGFHVTEVTEPWVINIVLDLSASFQVSIVDWEAGPESWLDAQ